jgi:hypothetical protein
MTDFVHIFNIILWNAITVCPQAEGLHQYNMAHTCSMGVMMSRPWASTETVISWPAAILE